MDSFWRCGDLRNPATAGPHAVWLGAGMGYVLIGGRIPAVDEHNQQAVLLFIIPIFGGTLLVAAAILFVLEVIKPSGTGMWFVGGLRSVPGRIARARRYSKITAIASRHGLGPALRGRAGGDEPQRQARLARSFREALEEAGVTFVKLGQVLSTRADLLSPEFVAELGKPARRSRRSTERSSRTAWTRS